MSDLRRYQDLCVELSGWLRRLQRNKQWDDTAEFVYQRLKEMEFVYQRLKEMGEED